MTWFKVDDGLVDHPKILKLQARKGWQCALALWTLAGAWSSRHLTDGSVPEAIVQRLGCTKKDAGLLVDAGLWARADGGYSFHQWTARNPTRKEVEQKREKTRSKVADWRSNQQRNRVTDAEVTQGRNPAPVPTRPDPSRPVPTRPVLLASPTEGSAEGAASPAPHADEPAASSVSQAKPPKAKRGKPLAEVALQEALRSKLGADAPALSNSLSQKAGQRVAAHAAESGGTLDASAALLTASWFALGNGNAWKLCDVPFRQHGAASTRGRVPPTQGTMAADWTDTPSVADQLKAAGYDA